MKAISELFFKSEPKQESNLPFPRCEHLSPAGRRCSQPICSTSPQFCLTHKPKPEQLLIAELTEAAGSLSTPEQINNFLTKVTLLRVQGRLTPKESCSYAYLCQILQRGQREIAFHQKIREERAEREAQEVRRKTHSNWNIPRPDRSGPDDPPSPTAITPSAPNLFPASGTSEQLSPAIVPASAGAASLPTPANSSTPSSAASLPAGGSLLSHPDRKPANSAACSGGTPATSAASAPLAATDVPSSVKSPAKKSSHSAISSSPDKSSGCSASSPSQLPPDFYNHFHPIDLTLPPGSQDLSKNIPHPDAAECARRNARRGLDFSRHRRSASRFFRFWR